jgi:crossover junction endodeoxyribonuclease RuvC
MSRVLGVDPGLHGAYALACGIGPALAEPMPLAGKEIDFGELAKEWAGFSVDFAVIERVHSMPKQGVSSAFTFGFGCGGVHGVLRALRIPIHYVTPQAWKKVVLAGTQKDKDAAIAWARSAYPDVKLIRPGCRVAHDGMADALAIAAYGLWTFGNGRSAA